MLRLGRKYEITAAKDNAIWRIHSEFPATLGDWLEVETDMTTIEDSPGVLTELLKMTYEFGIHSSIPTLAFHCLRAEPLVCNATA